MHFEKFEDLPIWQTAYKLERQVGQLISRGRFRQDWNLRDQLKRATVSMMGNVAEGFSRRSDKEFAQFLFIAKASAAEAQSHFYAALGRGRIDPREFAALYAEAESFSRQASGLITFLLQRTRKGTPAESSS